MFKKMIFLVFIFICAGCATEPYITQQNDGWLGYKNYYYSEIRSNTLVPYWANKYIGKKCWYKATEYPINEKLLPYRLQPLTVKEIKRVARNAYNKKGDIVLSLDDKIYYISFNEIKDVYVMKQSVATDGYTEDSFKRAFLWNDPYAINSGWSPDTWKLIKASKIAPGMTKDQVELSWGEFNREPDSKYVSDNYVKETYKKNNVYLIFINDVLESWYEQNS